MGVGFRHASLVTQTLNLPIEHITVHGSNSIALTHYENIIFGLNLQKPGLQVFPHRLACTRSKMDNAFFVVSTRTLSVYLYVAAVEVEVPEANFAQFRSAHAGVGEKQYDGAFSIGRWSGIAGF